MRVTAKTDYALRALIEIARQPDRAAISAEQLGRVQDIPRGFLQAILADLRRANIVLAQRGQFGGWRLSQDADSITVADVIRAVDGPLLSVSGVRPEDVKYNDAANVLQFVWIASRSSLREVLENVTLHQLAAGELPEEVSTRAANGDAWQAR